MTNQKAIDFPSHNGQFGWERIGGRQSILAIPVILRSNDVRYSPVRIVEQEIIKKYDALPQTIFQCITLKSFYLTSGEAKLLNNINFNHCNGRYGEMFFSTKDVIISATDVKELSRFLNISNQIFSHDLSTFTSRLGIIKLTLDPQNNNYTLLVPYIVKVYADSDRRFIPSRLVDPYVRYPPTAVQALPNDWDVMYLKMLSIYCENNSQQHIKRESSIVQLDGLLYSKTNNPIIYEDYTAKRNGL